MTVVRTDLIPNLSPNLIEGISKANPAVVTVPVISRVASTTGTIGTITGAGTTSSPWLATVSLMTTTAGLITGQIITATDGVGSFAAGGEVSIASVAGNQTIVLRKVGGTIPTAGTITNITLPAVSSLPAGIADGAIIQITGVEDATLTFTQSTPTGTYFRATNCSVSGTTLTIGTIISGDVAVNQLLTGVNSLLDGLSIIANVSGSGNGSTWTLSAAPGTLSAQVVTGILPEFQVGERVTQATTGAAGTVTGVNYDGASSTLNINTVSGTFNTTNFVKGSSSNAGITPTVVAGMTQLATAGANNTNWYYIDVLTPTTFALYRNVGLTTAVNSTAFSTAVANTGQYTTIDTVVITDAP
jgi:hypothetical protein